MLIYDEPVRAAGLRRPYQKSSAPVLGVLWVDRGQHAREIDGRSFYFLDAKSDSLPTDRNIDAVEISYVSERQVGRVEMGEETTLHDPITLSVEVIQRGLRPAKKGDTPFRVWCACFEAAKRLRPEAVADPSAD